MLVGNKTDAAEKRSTRFHLSFKLLLAREVSADEGEAKALLLGAMFIETSAKAVLISSTFLCSNVLRDFSWK